MPNINLTVKSIQDVYAAANDEGIPVGWVWQDPEASYNYELSPVYLAKPMPRRDPILIQMGDGNVWCPDAYPAANVPGSPPTGPQLDGQQTAWTVTNDDITPNQSTTLSVSPGVYLPNPDAHVTVSNGVMSW